MRHIIHAINSNEFTFCGKKASRKTGDIFPDELPFAPRFVGPMCDDCKARLRDNDPMGGERQPSAEQLLDAQEQVAKFVAMMTGVRSQFVNSGWSVEAAEQAALLLFSNRVAQAAAAAGKA